MNAVDTLRVLLVGSPERLKAITGALSAGGHEVMPVDSISEASEALLIQRFDAVLLGELPPGQVASLTSQIRDIERRTNAPGHIPVLSVVPDNSTVSGAGDAAIDGYVAESVDPDTLTLAIHRLASAIGAAPVEGRPLADSLPILDVANLKEQVAYDDELLVELIDLFLSERIRQVEEMRQCFAAGQFDQLSRVAHTIKGSLGSLHALAAKANAQGLETASREHDAVRSQGFLAALELDLDALEDELLKVRRSLAS